MVRQLKKHGKWLSVIAFLMLTATIAGGYILTQQRLANPFADFYTVNAEFSTTAGLNPGLGQAVNVAGVRVGTITSSKLRDGSAIVEMQVKPDKLDHIFKDAHAVLVPNSPLKDMQVELFPGTARAGAAPDEYTIPVARTAPPVDSDELTAALDTDTRRFFQVLVNGVDKGLDGRAADLQALLKTLEPTAADLNRVTGALAARRRELRRLVHSMAVLTRATATKDTELAQVIQGGNATLQALARQEGALRRSANRLPGTLRTTSATLANLADFTGELRPTLDGLLPALRRLKPALKATDDLALTAEPVIHTRLRPLVRELQPLAADLAPATRDLSAVTPRLSSAFKVLNYTVNELAYNPEGDDEGFLFWLSWFAHNANSFTSIQDAHGSAWRGVALVSCDALIKTAGNLGSAGAVLTPLLQTTIGSSPACR
jgi:phospholipid/cholesterol/gamma-HCH transport system substrate-binding protein